MKILLKPTNATLERRKELQAKIEDLLEEYKDVPILVGHKLTFFDDVDCTDPLFDFTEGEQKNQVHYIKECSFFSGISGTTIKTY